MRFLVSPSSRLIPVPRDLRRLSHVVTQLITIAAMIPEYVKQRKNGTSMIPQITSGTCHARIAPKIMLPPTNKARRRSPRRQTVIVASTKKISSKNKLTELREPHGFAMPNGTEIVSPPTRSDGVP